MISSVESAYDCISKQVLAFTDGRPWEAVGGVYEVFDGSIGSRWWLQWNGQRDERGPFPPRQVSYLANESLRYLRNDLLRTTGQRIWGLTFTLYPDGKFNIEYDYNKPDGYEETDETISGDEINESLARLGGKDDASS